MTFGGLKRRLLNFPDWKGHPGSLKSKLEGILKKRYHVMKAGPKQYMIYVLKFYLVLIHPHCIKYVESSEGYTFPQLLVSVSSFKNAKPSCSCKVMKNLLETVLKEGDRYSHLFPSIKLPVWIQLGYYTHIYIERKREIKSAYMPNTCNTPQIHIIICHLPCVTDPSLFQK